MKIDDKPPVPLHWSNLRDPWIVLSSGFGVGFIPRAPGTFASLFALLIWYLVFAEMPLYVRISIVVGVACVAWFTVKKVIDRFGCGDSSAIVADEIVGMWVALLFLPYAIIPYLIGFAAFRFLDISKPAPIGWVERRFENAFGILADDILAGAFVGIAWFVGSEISALMQQFPV